MGQDGCDKTDSFDEELNLSERATFAGEEEDFSLLFWRRRRLQDEDER